ncbi:MAG: FkbM family methyltransferase [Planctomycetes bacterium]|nr:FkbM family methyltransferase [Planctomycetota bacterium]
MAKEFIIKVNFGGLGDHLFYSHLPRIAKTCGGYDKVLISTKSTLRDKSYGQLIWDRNPFVDDYTEKEAPYPLFSKIPEAMNLLDKIMLERGLDDGLRYHEPEIYYAPRIIPELQGRRIYDPNYVTGAGAVSSEKLAEYFSTNGMPDYQFQLRSKAYPLDKPIRELVSESLLQYCDIIHSCGEFFCLTSGGATLAAALKKPVTVFHGIGHNPMFRHSKLHNYVQVSNSSVQPPTCPAQIPLDTSFDILPEVTAFRDALRAYVADSEVKVALDLGSLDGMVASAFREFFPDAKIFAFECNPDCIGLCERNLSEKSEIGLVRKAVSDVSGMVDFYAIDPKRTRTPHKDGNIGASSLFRADPAYPHEHYVQNMICVESTRLDDWADREGINQIDLIWMDLQGAELIALKGLGKLLNTVKAIYSEVSFLPTYLDQPYASTVDAFLRDHGFSLCKILYQDPWLGNVLYVRSESIRHLATGFQSNDLVPIQTNGNNPSHVADLSDTIKAGQNQLRKLADIQSLVPATKESRPEKISATETMFPISFPSPMVTICIITNSGLQGQEHRKKYLSRLLKSIEMAGFPNGNPEIIVAGAVDGNIPCAKVLALNHLAATGQLCTIRNAAWQAANTDIVIQCDDDVVFTKGYWNGVSKSLRDNWDILCTRLLNPNGTRNWDWAAFYPERGQTLLPYGVNDPNVYATGGHAIFRKRVTKNIKWDESLRYGTSEEFSFAAMARSLGYKFAFCPEATVFLQYPHCDAYSAVTGSAPKPPDSYCQEFQNLIQTLDLPTVPIEASSDRVLRDRLVHKLDGVMNGRDEKIDVSILVCCHRYLQRFRIFAQSICRQEFDLSRVEVVVANPHSPDGVSSFLETIRSALETQDTGPFFREVLIDPKHYRNRGLQIQAAFKTSSGTVAIGMDCDLVLPPDFLRRVVRSVNEHSNSVIGVYRRFLTPGTTEKILAGLVDPFGSFQQVAMEDEEENQGYRGVLGYCQAIKRHHWEKVGYPEEFDNIAKSDVSFVERLAGVGVSPLFLRDVYVLHLHHPRNWDGTKDYL